jgi:hypothetical protein
MSAVIGTLRATLRPRGTALFWGFYLFLTTIAVLFLHVARDPQSGKVMAMVLGFAAWMGWLLFLARLWQLQQHAESLCLSGGRRHVERAALLLTLLGTAAPALLLVQLGAPPGWALLCQLLSVAIALVYLLLTPTMGILLVLALSVLPLFLGQWLKPLLPDADALFLSLWALLGVLLAIGLPRWRRLIRSAPTDAGNAPQVVAIAERGLSGSNEQLNDPTSQWVGRGDACIPHAAGPRHRLLSLSILLCGPMAPLGWKNYLRSSAWMLVAVGLLAVLALSEAPERSGPSHSLVVLLGVWSLAVPLTLITRLRGVWHGDGHALAEVALLPGLCRSRGAWLQLAGAIMFTTGFRLLLPALLIGLLLTIREQTISAALWLYAVALWSLCLICALLALARRRGPWATILLYAGVSLVLIGVIGALLAGYDYGTTVVWKLLLPVTAGVLVLARLGWRYPAIGRPWVQPW